MSAYMYRLNGRISASLRSASTSTSALDPSRLCQLCGAILRNRTLYARTFTTSQTKYAAGTKPQSVTRSSPVKPKKAPLKILGDRGGMRREKDLYNLTGKQKRHLTSLEDARQLVASMDLVKTKKNLTVIDLYAGEGFLSQALLELPNVEQVIAVDPVTSNISRMEPLIEASAGRLQVLALDPFWWDTYRIIREKGLLDRVPTISWDETHPNLIITGQIPKSVNARRLVYQQLLCSVDQAWLYTLGRFESYFVLESNFSKKLMAPVGDKARTKAAVVIESCTSITELPWVSEKSQPTAKSPRALLSFVKFLPHFHHTPRDPIFTEALEFLAKNLFVHPSKPWSESLKYVAPGAENIQHIMKENGRAVDPAKQARAITAEEWQWITEAFLQWPFRPKDLDQDDVKQDIVDDRSGARRIY